MKVVHFEPVVRVDVGHTKQGKKFSVVRRSKPGRRCQKPRETGERLLCPFCGNPHPVLYFAIREGEEGERKVRTWECPKAGRMSLNLGAGFQQYVEGLIIGRRGKARNEGEQIEEQGEAYVQQGEQAVERSEKYAKVRKRLEAVIRNVGR